jgi:hypothetical protein
MRERKIVGKVYAMLRSKNPPARPKVPPAITVNSPTFSPRKLKGNWRRLMDAEKEPLRKPTWLKERWSSTAMKGRRR